MGGGVTVGGEALRGSRSLQREENPSSPLPSPTNPRRCADAASGEAATIPSRPTSHIPYGAAASTPPAPGGAGARPSSVDKLPRPASFFTAAAASNAGPHGDTAPPLVLSTQITRTICERPAVGRHGGGDE